MGDKNTGDALPSPDGWDDAPCGLLRTDRHGLVQSANAELLQRIGYDRSSVVGQLHWVDLLSVGSRIFYETQLAPVLELDGALREVMLDLRDASGQRIPVLVNAARSRDELGQTSGARIAVMSVPDRRAYETELRVARERAEHAQAADTRARFRLELLARANTALASSVDSEVALGRLARVLVAELSDWCVIYTYDLDRQPAVPATSAAHAHPSRQPGLERLAQLLAQPGRPTSGLRRAIESDQPVLLTQTSQDDYAASTDSREICDLYEHVGVASAVVIPVVRHGARVATTIVARDSARPPFTDEDLADLADLGTRTGIVIDNLQRRAREHNNSEALQQALLTTAPETSRVQIVTRYLPATAGNEVGGDWYDAFLQADGTPVVVIGDVVGHDIHAAAAMGQLRGVIRTLGYAGATPAHILEKTDTTAKGLGVDVLASALVARFDTSSGIPLLQWSNAGHPPPILLTASGAIQVLRDRPDPILGVVQDRVRRDRAVVLEVGDALLLYTDGLVERVDEDIDLGIARLTDQVASSYGMSLERLCDAVLVPHRQTRRDDIAILAVRYLG